jgi:hypothetical protein
MKKLNVLYQSKIVRLNLLSQFLDRQCDNCSNYYNLTDLISISIFKDTANYGYYCRRGQSCCGITGGCIPHDKICCSPNHRYCEPNHTCCGSHLCCPKEAECINGTCKIYT